ncbi:YopX family protein [Halobacillus aidingensis]|nr:YopX family protein [Halobacillus aidingensis]
MKQPKFKGFSMEHGKWFYGHGWFKIDWTEEYKQEKNIGDQAMLYTESSPVDCELGSMGQYTGYEDKHGNEIYQGDIVKRVDDIPITAEDGAEMYSTWTVTFEYGGWAFRNTPASPAISYPSFYSNAKYMEVIGNMYENPEYKNNPLTA